MLRVQEQSPDVNATGVATMTPVYFEIRNVDPDVINTTTLNVKINSASAISSGIFIAGYSGIIVPNIRGCDVYINHTTPFILGSIVTVLVNANGNDIASFSFTIVSSVTTAPVTIANPKSGTYISAQSVTLITNVPATTHYTVDGSMPILSSPVYSVPISITSNTTLKFFSIDSNNNKEYTHVEIYQIDTAAYDPNPPITSVSTPGGTYDTLTEVVLTTDKPATVYWTLNGVNPTTTTFTGKDSAPVTIKLSQGQNILKFFSVSLFGYQEIFQTQTYIILPKENNIVPTNVFVSFPYIKNTVDICWDDMLPIESNIVGYNVYKSPVDAYTLSNIISHDTITSDFTFSKDDHKFEKINKSLISTTFYRDKTLDRVIIQEDVSDQFRFKTLIDASTDFTGQKVNEQQWEAIDPDRLFNQSNGIYFTDVYGGEKSAIFQSTFRLKNDFEIETGYTLVNWPVTSNIQYEEAAFVISLNEFTYIKISRIRREAYDYYNAVLVVNSAEITRTEVVTTEFSGKMKITRYGSNITLSYFDGSNWVLLDSFLNFSNKDLQVKFYVKSADQSISVEFLYFHINLGQAYSPLIKDVRNDYTIQVQHYPIVSSIHDNEYTLLPEDVQVKIDGVNVLVKSVDGAIGLVTLNTERVYDDILMRWVEPIYPTPESIVTISYLFRIMPLRLNLSRFPFYKVTSVLSDGSETRLSWCTSTTATADKLDYMYQEAVRRNSWLLDQAGERVLLFLRKSTGTRCECYLRNMRTNKQAKVGPCLKCWGTRFIGGYEGPYEIRIAPLESEQKIMWSERGLKLDNIEETWTTLTPTITQRDFIIKRNSQIFSLGHVRIPTVRGIMLQQHFSMEHVDTTDIRYKFIQSLNLFSYASKNTGLRQPFDHFTQDAIIENGEIKENDRMRTDKSPGFNNEKGRTLTFENQLF